ncbi:MAG: DUF1349 domain-containing protein [Armatimonadetes bacterium]|nr:DUF1349 domain-containing protein [Armatimonadota bacterium]
MRQWRQSLVAMVVVVAALTGRAGAALPDGWAGRDVGSCIVPGSSLESGGTWTVKASGRDIGGTGDTFRFVYQTLKGDGSVVARVASLANTNEWAKAGVMVRASLDKDESFAMAAVTPANGVRLQSRPQQGAAATQSEAKAGGPAPYWVKLERAGGAVTASCSADGKEWKEVGKTDVRLPVVAYVGLCLTSHDNSTLGAATFDNVAVTRAGGAMPAPWKAADVGAVNPEGESALNAGKWTLTAAGADIWDPSDSFHFVYQVLSGDGTIVAKVLRLEAVDGWSKCGVMVRETLNPASAHIMAVVSGSNGVHVQLRPSTDGACLDSAQNAGEAAPYWVKLQRKGDTFTGFCSKDGKEWAQVHQTDVKMAKDVLVGLCLTSHNEGQATTAEVSDVTVTQG